MYSYIRPFSATILPQVAHRFIELPTSSNKRSSMTRSATPLTTLVINDRFAPQKTLYTDSTRLARVCKPVWAEAHIQKPAAWGIRGWGNIASVLLPISLIQQWFDAFIRHESTLLSDRLEFVLLPIAVSLSAEYLVLAIGLCFVPSPAE